MKKQFYFSTKDLITLAILAALGGISSTYINALGDATQAIAGVPGLTQWAAGLHVLWIVLALGITQKIGAGTVIGILKGFIELLSGNTHGIIILLVDLVAGILVDLVFFVFNKRQSIWVYCLAGALATSANVLVFQIFATVPANMLGYLAIAVLWVVAFLSGVIFSGILANLLLVALRKAGVVKESPPPPLKRHTTMIFFIALIVVALLLAIFFRIALKGSETITINGAVNTPLVFPSDDIEVSLVEAYGTLNEVTSLYKGYPLNAIIQAAHPQPQAQLLLIKAADGYTFMLTMQELETNQSLLLSPQKNSNKTSYDLVGATSRKAWVRGISEITLIAAKSLPFSGLLALPADFTPSDWQTEMDSTNLTVDGKTHKLQGVPLQKILAAMQPSNDVTEIVFFDGEKSHVMQLDAVMGNPQIRIFTLFNDQAMIYILADMNGTVYFHPIDKVVLQ